MDKKTLQETYDKLLIGAKVSVLCADAIGVRSVQEGILIDKYLVLDKGPHNNVFVDVLLKGGRILEQHYFFFGTTQTVQVLS